MVVDVQLNSELIISYLYIDDLNNNNFWKSLELWRVTKFPYASVGIDLFQRMFQVGEDCEVMIRVDEDSEEEDFQLVSGLLKYHHWVRSKLCSHSKLTIF